MATTVYKSEEITLYSGKVITLRPLKISILRAFMTEFERMADAMSDNNKSIDVIMDCVAIAMRQYDPELADNREALEDELDLPTAYKVIEVGAGIKLNDDDPNQ